MAEGYNNLRIGQDSLANRKARFDWFIQSQNMHANILNGELTFQFSLWVFKLYHDEKVNEKYL